MLSQNVFHKGLNEFGSKPIPNYKIGISKTEIPDSDLKYPKCGQPAILQLQ
jgi:hypothetical protein